MTTQELVDDAKCIFTCIPPGMQGAVLISLLNTIVTSGIGSASAGAGSPQGIVTATPGSTYWDQTNKIFWVKDSGTGNTGWYELVG